jgi:hypothetical protein
MSKKTFDEVMDFYAAFLLDDKVNPETMRDLVFYGGTVPYAAAGRRAIHL